MNKPLVLASRSQARARLLRYAGVDVKISPADIDEAALKRSMVLQGMALPETATALAEEKARECNRKNPDCLILAADQILVFKGKIFDKPKSVIEAKAQLQALRGHSHSLVSAAVIYENSIRVWSCASQVKLSMRPFTDAFLNSYIETVGDDLFTTVGGYKLESIGSQLFSGIKGDYFSVLGLPLLEVLEFLRGQGICQT